MADKIVVLRHTHDYMGDHTVSIIVAYTFPASTTLGELMDLLKDKWRTSAYSDADWLEIPVQARVKAEGGEQGGY